MALDVVTHDCDAVTDAELDEMAELNGDGRHAFSIGMLSKQVERWVLCTMARDEGALKGFVFSTLERIGGTPTVLIGVASNVADEGGEQVVRGLMDELYHRALMAFPDEDVLFGSMMNRIDQLDSYRDLAEIIPRPDYRPNGEERAWGRRLAKRFQIGTSRYGDRTFVVSGNNEQLPMGDFVSDGADVDPAYGELFQALDHDAGDAIIVHGWVSPERLVELGSR